MSTPLQLEARTDHRPIASGGGKRILMLTHEFPPFRGGIATYCAELARAAHELGHDITVVAPRYETDQYESDTNTYPFKVVRYRGGSYSYRCLPKVLFRTLRTVHASDYDLIHAADPSYVLALAFLNRFTRIPHVATAYGTELLGLSKSRQARALGVADMFRHASTVYAISNFTRSLVEESCADHAGLSVAVTPLGVNDSWFKQAAPGDIRTELGIGSDRVIMLTVSRLDERKGHRLILKALRLLPAEVKRNLTYCIVGESGTIDYVRELHDLADESGVQVVFTGGISRVLLQRLYAASAFFCMPGEPHPKRVEGFGLVYLEAAAQGLPSIASRLGAVPEIVRHGETGLVVEPADIDQLALSIARMVSDGDFRKMLGQNAKAMAAEYTWRRCAELTYGK